MDWTKLGWELLNRWVTILTYKLVVLWAQAVSRRPVAAEAWVSARVIKFVVDKVALDQVSLWVLRFSPVNIITPWPVGSRSSET
jgi:hypothetical protein